MPITQFSSFNDGLAPGHRGHGNFIANVELDNDRKWIPYAEGVWLQPCSFDLSAGALSLVLKGLPGASLGVHYHVGQVYGFTLNGNWRYLEHDWIAGPGTFVFEPAGEAHSLVVTEDSSEPAVIFFMISGALLYLDKPENGTFAAYEDAFSSLEFFRAGYREAGLDAKELDRLIR
jgi:2,4'-dihydroxyacetophenone dioxygenase